MPSSAFRAVTPNTGKFALLSVMSHDRGGRLYPFGFDEPRKTAIEANCTPIRYRGRTHAHDRAAQDAAADARTIVVALDVKVHIHSWQEPMRRFDQRAARRDVDQARPVSRTHTGSDDAVVFE